MRIILFFLTFFFFVGCTQNTPQTPIKESVETVSQDKEFDELDRIEREFNYELDPGVNAMKQINSMACPVK